MRDFIDDLARATAFLSRLPMPDRHFAGFDGRLGRAVRAFPLAGVLIALPAAAAVCILMAVHADPLFSAVVAIAVQTLITGALHEDGLADAADGLYGGRTREAALAIMKDSRIGAYGAIALILSFSLRVSALAAILPQLSPLGAGLALLGIAALSRTAMVWHWSRLPSARPDGVAGAAGLPEPASVTVALASGSAVAVLLFVSSGMPLLAVGIALAAFAATVPGVGKIVRTRIGGHTGDTIGATQQMVEIAVLAALALAV